jgi:hypothetical protein
VEQFEKMKSNAHLNEVYEFYVPDPWMKPDQNSTMEYRKEYITAKYVNVYFTSPNNEIPGMPYY